MVPRHRRPCVPPCVCPPCAYPRHAWKKAWPQGNQGRLAALGGRSLGRLNHKNRKVGHRIFHDIGGRQGAVGWGGVSSTVRLLHRASCLIHCSLCCWRAPVLSRSSSSSSGSRGVYLSLRRSRSRARFCTDVEARMGRE